MYRFEKNGEDRDIIIDGFEGGIADDPYEGLADVRNINNISTPKEAAVNFANAAMALPPVVNATSFTAYPSTVTASVLIIGGGGAGGSANNGNQGGGGGAGGGFNSLTGVTIINGNGVSITVGAAGASAGTGNHVGGDGGQSAYGVTTAGGGGGGGGGNATNGDNGGSGTVQGSGGGGGGGGGSGGTGTFAGGSSATAGGGGGGSSAIGTNASGTTGGNGGNGTASSISGSAVTYSGGGYGDGAASGTAGTGSTNPGGGGNGKAGGAGGAGQAGIVIISVQQGIIASATGGTHTTSGGNDIWTFTTSGTWTPTFNSFTANTVAVSSTAGWYAGMAIIINSVTNASPLSATAGSNTYYVLITSPGIITLYNDLTCQSQITITQYGTGTLSTAQFGTPVASTPGYTGDINASGILSNQQPVFIIDSKAQAWVIGNGVRGYGLNVLQFLGNTGSAARGSAPNNGLGIVTWQQYLFLFIDAASPEIDIINLTNLGADVPNALFGTTSSNGPNGNWTIAWNGLTLAHSEVNYAAINATDGAIYFCNGLSGVGSVLAKGSSGFEPDDSATYTASASALSLPPNDYPVSLAQLSTNLLVGGIQNYIYPWDRTSTSFGYPIFVAESFISNIVSTNQAAYVFAGTRGRIYITNGSQVSLFKKFPDQISGTEYPYYTWNTALYFRNQLYFSLSATNNAGTAINNFSGVWALSLELATTIGSVAYGSTAGPIKLLNSLSTGSYAGSAPVIVPMGNANAAGNALYVGWIDGSGNGGIDYGTSSPYVNYESYIDTDIIPIGTFYKPLTNRQIEYKVSRPLVTGEGIDIYWRGNLTDAFTLIPKDSGTHTWTTTGKVADAVPVNFQKQQWIQFRVKLLSTASSPSFTRLREIRLR